MSFMYSICGTKSLCCFNEILLHFDVDYLFANLLASFLMYANMI